MYPVEKHGVTGLKIPCLRSVIESRSGYGRNTNYGADVQRYLRVDIYAWSRTAPYDFAFNKTAPHHTAPHRTAKQNPYCTAP